MFVKRIAALALCTLLFACAVPKAPSDENILINAKCVDGEVSVFVYSIGPGSFNFVLGKSICGVDI